MAPGLMGFGGMQPDEKLIEAQKEQAIKALNEQHSQQVPASLSMSAARGRCEAPVDSFACSVLCSMPSCAVLDLGLLLEILRPALWCFEVALMKGRLDQLFPTQKPAKKSEEPQGNDLRALSQACKQLHHEQVTIH